MEHLLCIYVKGPVLSYFQAKKKKKKKLPLIFIRISETVVDETQAKIGLKHKTQSSRLYRREGKKIE
jgi:hypothetical protein